MRLLASIICHLLMFSTAMATDVHMGVAGKNECYLIKDTRPGGNFTLESSPHITVQCPAFEILEVRKGYDFITAFAYEVECEALDQSSGKKSPYLQGLPKAQVEKLAYEALKKLESKLACSTVNKAIKY